MRAWIDTHAVSVFCLIIFVISSSSAFSAVFVNTDGETHHVQTIKIEDVEYVSVNQLSSILEAEVYWHRMHRKVVLDLDEHQIVFTWFSPYLLYDSQVYNLTFEVKPKGGTLWVPLKAFQRIWHSINDYPLGYTGGFVPREAPEGPRFEVLDLDITEKVNGILVEIHLSRPGQYEVFSHQNRYLNINFYQAQIDVEHFNRKKIPRFLRWVKAYQFENSAQLSLRFKKQFVKFTHNLRAQPNRIQISLIHTSSSSDSAKLYLSQTQHQRRSALDDLLDVIVIDPGHGGPDSGAVGKSGLLEKEVTLDIATRLRDLLQADSGLTIILTRERDELVPLEERTQIANRNAADLFISIHTNSFQKRSVRGSGTFFLATAKNDEARAAAALENSSIRFEYPGEASEWKDDLDFILMDLIQNEYLKESMEFAAAIQKKLKKNLSIPSRGVSQAGFVVLNQAYMPAVLVEMAFISNRKDEKLLKKDSFRQKVAEALYEGITDFKEKYESPN
jgi:N-acetylmuramoyl-L-alanine amidase